MAKGYDLIGKRFGKLTVIEKLDYTYQGNKMWKCKCDCGKEFDVSTARLTRKNKSVKSCGKCRVVKGINDISTTAPWMVKYFLNKEDCYMNTYGSGKYVDVICPNCQMVKKYIIKELYNRKSIAC